jgi:surface rod structure-forming protein G
MADIFSTLLFVALILLIWVLVAPKSLARRSKYEVTRRKTGSLFAVIVLVLLILVGLTVPSQPAKNQPVHLTTAKTSVKTATPTITEKTETQTKSIAFTSSTVQDSNLAKGTTQVTTVGVNGAETLTYQVTYTNGKLTSQKLTSTVITTQPINQVTSIGTYVAPAQTTTTPASPSCYPLTNGGNCYEPGEYCRTSDYGTSGVAGDGESITCEDNDGWRWEPN